MFVSIVSKTRGLVQADYSWVEASQYKCKMLAKIELSTLLSSESLKLIREELSKADCEVQHVLNAKRRDPQTFENCTVWAHTHIEIAEIALTKLLMHIVAFPDSRKYISCELNVLRIAVDDVNSARIYKNDPDASHNFLSRANKHIGTAIDIYTQLTNIVQFYAISYK